MACSERCACSETWPTSSVSCPVISTICRTRPCTFSTNRLVDQLTVDVHTVRVVPLGQALADIHRAVATEQAHHVGVVAEEVAVGAVLDLREDGDGLFAPGHVALRGAIVEPLHRAQFDLDVVLKLAAFLLQQTLTGLGHFISSQILQHPRRRGAEHQREEVTGTSASRITLAFNVRCIVIVLVRSQRKNGATRLSAAPFRS